MILGFVFHAAAIFSHSILWEKTNFISNFYDNNCKSKNIVDKNSSLLLKPSEHLKHSVNQFNNMSSDDINSDDPENTVSSIYYNIEEIQNLKITNKSKSLSLFHLNACSLSKNFDDLQYLSCTKKPSL